MAQVLFFTWRLGENPRKVLGGTCTSPILIVTAVAQPTRSNDKSQCTSRLRAEHSLSYCPGPKGNRINFLRRPTSPFPLVTFSLQACSAKYIFAKKLSFQSKISRVIACNVAELTSIFQKNTSISYAVDDSLDRLMLNKKHAIDVLVCSHFGWTTSHVATYHRRAFWRRPTDRWAS
jgi:hypothetical protein